MKNLLSLALLLGATYSGFSQGTVNFNNRVSTAVDAPVSYPAGGPKPAGKIDGATTGATALAGLFAGPDGATEQQLILVGPAVGFRSGAAAGYVNVGTEGTRIINGVAAGDFAMVQIRVWDTFVPDSTWESALSNPSAYKGRSNILRLQTGGAGNPPSLPANLVGLQAFSFIPEPGTIAIAILGCAGALVIARRRK